MFPPFPELIRSLTRTGKTPSGAEVAVYLLVTSQEWRDAVGELWDPSITLEPPSEAEWQRIGQWVMGQEDDPNLKFLADIISGPVDADKLDYVFRDGYVAGIPVGYDLERLVSTVCVDPQESATDKRIWWRLTLPIKGINALEQLVMGRLVLNSYLYHHQKCRAAETAFERALAREYLRSGTVLGKSSVWDLFAIQDADVHAFAQGDSGTARALWHLLNRQLRVAIAEFRSRDLATPASSEAASVAFSTLHELGNPKSFPGYADLIRFEDLLARRAGLPKGSVVVDVPRPPSYADLENLMLPGRSPTEQEYPTKVLNYRDWISAYSVHRAWIRVFGPRGKDSEDALWEATRRTLEERGLTLPETVRRVRV